MSDVDFLTLAVAGAALLLTYAVLWAGAAISRTSASMPLKYFAMGLRYLGIALLVVAVVGAAR